MSDDNLALIIGLSRYPYLHNLDGTENDAESFYNWLKSVSGGALREENILTIKSDHYQNDRPDYYDIWEKIKDRCCNQAKRHRGLIPQRVYIFLAGHGLMTDKDPRPTNCLLPANAREGISGAHFPAEAFATQLIQKGLCNSVCLFYDCCRIAGHQISAQSIEWPKGNDIPGAPVDHIFGLFACLPGFPSREARDPYNRMVRGHFSSSLLMGLSERAALIDLATLEFPRTSYDTGQGFQNHIGKVTSDSIFEFVRKRVSLISNQTVSSPLRPPAPFILSSPPLSESMKIYVWHRGPLTLELLDSQFNRQSPSQSLQGDRFAIQGWIVQRNAYVLRVGGRDINVHGELGANILEIFA